MTETYAHSITKLKKHEGDNAYFWPVTNYDNFTTHNLQRKEERQVSEIQCSPLKRRQLKHNKKGRPANKNFHFDKTPLWKYFINLLKLDKGDTKFFFNILLQDQYDIRNSQQRQGRAAQSS